MTTTGVSVVGTTAGELIVISDVKTTVEDCPDPSGTVSLSVISETTTVCGPDEPVDADSVTVKPDGREDDNTPVEPLAPAELVPSGIVTTVVPDGRVIVTALPLGELPAELDEVPSVMVNTLG